MPKGYRRYPIPERIRCSRCREEKFFADYLPRAFECGWQAKTTCHECREGKKERDRRREEIKRREAGVRTKGIDGLSPWSKDHAPRCGVYSLDFTDEVRYVGSSDDLDKRAYNHLVSLRAGTHEQPALQNAYDEYGDPEWVLLALCGEDERRGLEHRAYETGRFVLNVRAPLGG